MTMRNLMRAVAACALGVAAASASAADTIVVGGKDFTEQQIMADMTSQLLSAKGYKVDTRSGMGSTVLRKAQLNGQVDVYWEYTGTSLVTYNKIKTRMSPEETYQTVKKLDAEKGLVWLDPSKADNTYALVMREAEARAKGIKTISDLAKAIDAGQKLTFATDAEFAARPDGMRPMEKTYGFKFGIANVKNMDPGLTYQALRDKQVDVALAFATDGRIPAFHFVILEDDKHFFPSYALTPVIRQDTLKAHPKLAGLLNSLSAKLDDQVMSHLNASVDVEKKSVRDVARDFLKQAGLI